MTTKTKTMHTPGPWYANIAEVDEFGHYWVQVSPRDTEKLAVAYAWGSHKNDTVDANARLIAAAPELLEALKVAVEELSHEAPDYCWATGPLTGNRIEDLVVCPGCRFLKQAERVIAKVEGATNDNQ